METRTPLSNAIDMAYYTKYSHDVRPSIILMHKKTLKLLIAEINRLSTMKADYKLHKKGKLLEYRGCKIYRTADIKPGRIKIM